MGVVMMMYGYGLGLGWMILTGVIWLVVIGAIVWAAVRLAQGWEARDRGHGPTQPPMRTQPETQPETPEEILARRFARGEIDEEAYDSARDRLAARHPR